MKPVRLAADLFFCRQLRFRWQGGPRFELTDPRKPAADAAPTTAELQQRELALMLDELAAVLDEMPDVRDAVRHLSFIEQALRQRGLAALHAVPLEVLQLALEQFEGLVSNWSPRGLATLRSKMAVVAMDRDYHGDPSGLPPPVLLPPAAAGKLSAGRR